MTKGEGGASNSFYYLNNDGEVIEAKTLQIVSQWRAQDEYRLNRMQWEIRTAKIFAVTAWSTIIILMGLYLMGYL